MNRPVSAARDQELVSAVREGDIERARKLLNSKADANAIDSDGTPALVWAGTCGNYVLVRMLLAAGASPDLQDGKKRTALFYAATGPTVKDRERYRTKQELLDAEESVQLLLKGTDLTLKDDDGKTALEWVKDYRLTRSLGYAFSPSLSEKRQRLDRIIKSIERAATLQILKDPSLGD